MNRFIIWFMIEAECDWVNSNARGDIWRAYLRRHHKLARRAIGRCALTLASDGNRRAVYLMRCN